MSASPPCATPPGAPPPVPPDTLLAAANMRRLLEVYRSLAPLTIGGPSSTSLETSRGPASDPRLLRKMAGPGYPWMLGPGFPPPPPHPAPASPLMAEHRKRHLSSERRGCPSPAPPIFSPRDKESSRSGARVCDTEGRNEAARSNIMLKISVFFWPLRVRLIRVSQSEAGDDWPISTKDTVHSSPGLNQTITDGDGPPRRS